ncbi:hypothetical protein OPIT5_03480 [Opitutaceae bacterium TAV5]|nr:hypothetical protein OPIT5_03480 [Opitutaceae bacterium TAV5]
MFISPFVTALFKLTALFLLGLWLPAVGHCDLEAAGIIAFSAGEDTGCCSQAGSPAERDNCDIVENDNPRPAGNLAALPRPVFFVDDAAGRLALLLARLETSELAAPPVGGTDRPRAWVPVWQFVQRAAPSPRAPSVIFA